MGSIGLYREKGTTNADFFAAELGVEVVADATIAGVWYGAIKAPGSDDVFAYVSPISWNRSSYGYGGTNFTYKMQDETMGPYDNKAPAKVLDALTPIDSEYANEWRQRCRDRLARLAALPKVRNGTVVRFTDAIEFSDGVTERDFTFVERTRFRRVNDGRQVRITGWKERSFETAESEGVTG